MTFLIVFGGWAAASVATGAVLAMWRMRAARLEAIAHACHELRGPLTAARLGLGLGSDPGELTPARLRAVDLELARASLALDDLELARASLPLDELGRARRRRPATRAAEHVDVGELLADSVEAWRAAGARAGVELVGRWSGPTARLVGDRVRLAQATGNLIANAIEHGGGAVEVRGRTDGAAAVRIEVVDGGPGLPAPIAVLMRHANRDRGRRGRGLAIAAAIAAGHGGRLAAAPSERGARLVLELPITLGSGQVHVTPGPEG